MTCTAPATSKSHCPAERFIELWAWCSQKHEIGCSREACLPDFMNGLRSLPTCDSGIVDHSVPCCASLCFVQSSSSKHVMEVEFVEILSFSPGLGSVESIPCLPTCFYQVSRTTHTRVHGRFPYMFFENFRKITLLTSCILTSRNVAVEGDSCYGQ